MPLRAHIQDYYLLTKPGIIRANVMTALAGFLLASQGRPRLLVLAALLVGNALVIAAGCVYNNYLDREIDKRMQRTKKRALVTGAISVRVALVYGTLLGLAGFYLLARYTNWLTVAVGLVGIIDYVGVYGYVKRRSMHGTLVGGISGATSIVAGYTAVTNRLDAGAVILFCLMFFWQMPHFYAIAIFRRDDYQAAGVPVISIKKGMQATKRAMVVYAGAFLAMVPLLTVFGYAGYTYLVVMVALGIWWMVLGLRGVQHTGNDSKWAGKMFGVSLVILTVMSVMVSVMAFLP